MALILNEAQANAVAVALAHLTNVGSQYSEMWFNGPQVVADQNADFTIVVEHGDALEQYEYHEDFFKAYGLEH